MVGFAFLAALIPMLLSAMGAGAAGAGAAGAGAAGAGALGTAGTAALPVAAGAAGTAAPLLTSAAAAAPPAVGAAIPAGGSSGIMSGLMGSSFGKGFMSSLGQNLAGQLMRPGGGQAAQQAPYADYALAPPPTVTAGEPMNLDELIAQAFGSQSGGSGPMTLLPAPMVG